MATLCGKCKGKAIVGFKFKDNRGAILCTACGGAGALDIDPTEPCPFSPSHPGKAGWLAIRRKAGQPLWNALDAVTEAEQARRRFVKRMNG